MTRAAEALKWLEQNSTRAALDGMARYGIPSDNALGVPMGAIKAYGKKLGTDQALSLALWNTGCYEARSLAAFVGDPGKVTSKQMTDWAKGFDNWAIVDTVCFSLFDKTPLAWKQVKPWCKAKPEFVKRAGYALLACLALHDKTAADKTFLDLLPLVEEGAQDDRNFVYKGAGWALKAIGGRSAALRKEALAVAKRLTASGDEGPRWVGKDALRQMAKR